MRRIRILSVVSLAACCLAMECPTDGTGGLPIGGAVGGSDRDFAAMPRLFVTTDRSTVAAYDMPTTIDGAVAADETLDVDATNISRVLEGVAVNGIGNLIVLWKEAPPVNSSEIRVFSDAGAVDGQQTPVRVVAGSATRLDRSDVLGVDIALDKTRDILYVSQDGDPDDYDSVDSRDDLREVLIFANTSQASFNGNIAPTGVVRLGELGTASPIAIDSERDILYVLNSRAERDDAPADAREILVFENASTLDGMPTPDRVISTLDFGTNLFTGNTRGSGPISLYVDASNDTLYALTPTTRTFILPDVSTLDGEIGTVQSMTLMVPESTGGFDNYDPKDVHVDAQGTGYFLGSPVQGNNDDPQLSSILIVDNVATASGSTMPDRALDLDLGEFANAEALTIAD